MGEEVQITQSLGSRGEDIDFILIVIESHWRVELEKDKRSDLIYTMGGQE